jgi:hypothetical protein|tara:strand:- start:2679 stop:3209 length:531 start_codon:yes stop_codon:yes gene_type:complete
MNLSPPLAPPLRFDAQKAQAIFEVYGGDCGPCGPGAIAAIAGVELEDAIRAVGPKWLKLKGTTEIMLADALDTLGQDWSRIEPRRPAYGLARIQWVGPWLDDPDPFEKFRHSHWIGMADAETGPQVFDINAISIGGWISLQHWDADLRPWLLDEVEPQATGEWFISDAYEVRRTPR